LVVVGRRGARTGQQASACTRLNCDDAPLTLPMGWNPRYTHPSPYATSDDYLTHPNLLVDMQNPNHTNP